MRTLLLVWLFLLIPFSALAQNFPETEQSAQINGYITTVKEIQGRISQTVTGMAGGLQAAVDQGNRSLRNAMMLEIQKVLSVSLEEFRELSPPEGFESYHQKMMDAYVFRQLSNDAFLREQAHEAHAFDEQAGEAEKAAAQELKLLQEQNTLL